MGIDRGDISHEYAYVHSLNANTLFIARRPSTQYTHAFHR